VFTDNGGTSPHLTPAVRNVTALATGPGSTGLSYTLFGSDNDNANPSERVDASAVIAKGIKVDVLATSGALGNKAGSGGEISITLRHSDFVSSREITEQAATGARAEVVEGPGNLANQPKFAADGVHQLADSMTIDNGGPADALTGPLDIDGQQRVQGAAVDIGADESPAESVCPVGTVESGGQCVPVPPQSPPATPEAPKAQPPAATVQAVPAPETKIQRGPKKRTGAHTATFVLRSSQPSRFQYRLDGKPYKAAKRRLKLKGLKEGKHTLEVRAVNGSGVADPTPAVFHWKITR
jgi:hypothetical protein